MSPPSLRWYTHNTPRKKFRGKRRYFRNLRKRALQFTLRVEERTWWHYWHYHADWRGWGNLGWSYRLPHIEALCEVFRTIARSAPRFPTEFQAWILLNGEDAGQDAVFLHSPNPHDTPFPVDPPEIASDDAALGRAFSSLLPEMKLRFGWSRNLYVDDGVERCATTYWVWAEGIGLPLWPSHEP
jgi:hypothetical protein